MLHGWAIATQKRKYAVSKKNVVDAYLSRQLHLKQKLQGLTKKKIYIYNNKSLLDILQAFFQALDDGTHDPELQSLLRP